jgi:hypothetical protein
MRVWNIHVHSSPSKSLIIASECFAYVMCLEQCINEYENRFQTMNKYSELEKSAVKEWDVWSFIKCLLTSLIFTIYFLDNGMMKFFRQLLSSITWWRWWWWRRWCETINELLIWSIYSHSVSHSYTHSNLSYLEQIINKKKWTYGKLFVYENERVEAPTPS